MVFLNVIPFQLSILDISFGGKCLESKLKI